MDSICNTFTVVDLETTGLDAKKDKITEIAAIKVVDGKIVDTFHRYVNPGKMLEERIADLTGLSDDKLKDAPFISEVIPDFVAFETTGVLLGHSILFDFSFLKRAAVNAGLTFQKDGIDTLFIARKYLQELESRALPFLCRHFEIEHEPHRAMSDTTATFELYLKLWELFQDKEDIVKDFTPKELIYQVKKESPIAQKQIEQLKRFIEYYKIDFQDDILHLTKNEASRLIDQLISQYGKLPPRNG